MRKSRRLKEFLNLAVCISLDHLFLIRSAYFSAKCKQLFNVVHQTEFVAICMFIKQPSLFHVVKYLIENKGFQAVLSFFFKYMFKS